MSSDFYVTFTSHVPNPLNNDVDGKHEVALVNFIIKNTCDILKKDRVYDIQVKPHDWPLFTEEWIETINSGEYPFITLPYKEFGSGNYLCRAIDRRISAPKKCFLSI